jgi:hypothetical protein
MKLLKLNLVAIFCLCLLPTLKAQDKMGKIYFIRATNYVGTMINYGFYIDDQLACKLKNNHYSIHDVPAGEHQVSVQDRGYGKRKKSKPLTVNVKEGEISYLSVGAGSSLYLQEVTGASAEELLKKVAINKDCSGNENNK